MKRTITKSLLYLMLCFIGFSSQGQVSRVMTYNIRYDNPGDNINRWDNRKEGVADLLRYYEPQLFGLQEGLLHQLEYLDEQLLNYTRIGVGRDDGKLKGEFCAIYYRNDEFELVEESTFWLSETDDTISVGWDASMERICTYGLFMNKITHEKVWVFNAHFDHMGQEARKMSASLIVNKIKNINEDAYPVVLMGDFNAEPLSSPITIIRDELTDGAESSPHGVYGPAGTFTGFEQGALAIRRIDYVFVKGLEVISYRHVDDKTRSNNYLSDHLPVFVEFKD